MDLWGSSNLGGGGSSTATLPDQISNLACTGGTDGSQGTIDVSFTEVPATSFDLLKYYILIYKAGGIPQTPFDGTRITLPKGTAGAKLEHQITGLTFDQLYGVRVYPVSVKNQFQTLVEGATATATPVAGIRLDSLMAGTEVDRIKGISKNPNVICYVLQHDFKPGKTLVLYNDVIGQSIWTSKSYTTSEGTYYPDNNLDSYVVSNAPNYFTSEILAKIPSVSIECWLSYPKEMHTVKRKFFVLSGYQVGYHSGEIEDLWVKSEDSRIEYFLYGGNSVRKSVLSNAWTRSTNSNGYVGDAGVWVYVTSDGAVNAVYRNSNTAKNNVKFAFCLPSDMLFNPQPDTDGCYIPM